MYSEKVKDNMEYKTSQDKRNRVIFFCDIDGTILKGDMEVPRQVIAEAKKFMDLGGILCLCTGRAPVSVEAIAKKLETNGPSILYSGAAGFDFLTGEYLWYDVLEKSVEGKIEALLGQYPRISLQVYTKDTIYLLNNNSVLRNKGVKDELAQNVSQMSDIRHYEEVIKLVLTAEDPQELEQCKQEIFNSSKYIFEFASKHFVEVIPSTGGKDRGALRMVEYLGLKNPIIMSAGDAMTDLPLLKMSNLSFAPKDAKKEVVQAASYVFPSYKNAGVADAFYHASKVLMDKNSLI